MVACSAGAARILGVKAKRQLRRRGGQPGERTAAAAVAAEASGSPEVRERRMPQAVFGADPRRPTSLRRMRRGAFACPQAWTFGQLVRGARPVDTATVDNDAFPRVILAATLLLVVAWIFYVLFGQIAVFTVIGFVVAATIVRLALDD